MSYPTDPLTTCTLRPGANLARKEWDSWIVWCIELAVRKRHTLQHRRWWRYGQTLKRPSRPFQRTHAPASLIPRDGGDMARHWIHRAGRPDADCRVHGQATDGTIIGGWPLEEPRVDEGASTEVSTRMKNMSSINIRHVPKSKLRLKLTAAQFRQRL